MPNYDYQCSKCEHTFEVFHKIGESGPKRCPECGGRKIIRLVSSPPAYHHHYSPMHPRATRGRGY